MVGTDVYRPAAIDQLITLGEQIDVPVFSLGTDADPVEIARQGVEKGKRDGGRYGYCRYCRTTANR